MGKIKDDDSWQVDILTYLESGKKLSAKDIGKAITELLKAQATLVRREMHEKRRLAEKEAQAKREREKEELEKTIRDATSMELPIDYENAFGKDESANGVRAESISDGLILSLNNLGRVDIEYISLVSGETHRKVIETLKGAIYQNPEKWEECFYKGWETADEYLTGNLSKKFNAAKAADTKYRGLFADNLRAISKIIPPSVATDEIFITLGSPWVPADIIDDFIEYLLGKSFCSGQDFARVKHDSLTDTWDIPMKSRYNDNPKSYSAYGTKRLQALHILEKTLNMKSLSVCDEVPCHTNKSGVKRVLNKSETTLALEKQKQMIRAFKNWVWQDERRKDRLIEIFEEKYSCFRRRRYDGSFLKFPDLDKSVSLYPYQKNAVARILFSPNTLLAHDVGSGKTYIMIAAGMELRRMGLSKKNLFVVPNNIIGQWEKIFLTMYPSARLKIVEPKDFVPKKRERVLTQIINDDYDGIIMAYSCFDMIPLSKEYYLNELEIKKNVLEEYEKDEKKNTSGIQSEKKKIIKQLKELANKVVKTSCVTCFDELGITRLFVDEAHNYKNLPIKTKIERVMGLTTDGSKKCADMLDKVRLVQKSGGVVMATGTPITNSITDAYIMQLYLQGGELALLDLQSFDAWVGMFAERKSEFEIDVDTNGYRLATRFSKFHNLPELTSLLSSIADFHTTKRSEELPEFKGYNDCLLGKTQDFNEYLKTISSRADAVRSGMVNRKDDNMLLITTDGRKAALDLRLVDESKGFTFESKVFRCAENVFKIYYKSRAERLTQLVFCDTSTPKDGFNIYDELKRILISFGVNGDEIAYIHDATTESKRKELFEKTRKGEIRILIGSTFKLGLGVNVQDKLVAVHHLDIPWRPADMVQREGRIIRPGNCNKEIFIYRYITEGSFDAYSWQLLETKQNFISALLSGSMEERQMSDIENTVLGYAEVKALAIGNPLVKERVEKANELTRLKQLQAKAIEMKEGLAREASLIPKEIEEYKERIKKCEEDLAFYNEEKVRLLAEREREDRGKDEKVLKAEKSEKRNKFNESVYGEVLKNVLKTKESYLTDYCGFKIILPANMLLIKPYVYLERQGRYYVELGESDKGVTVRLYHCLEGLAERLDKLKARLSETLERQKNIETELAKDVDYSEEIAELKIKMEKIDKKLGVKK